MKTWYFNEKNELVLEYGQLKVVDDMQALRCRIDAALQVVKGELDDENLGVDYFGIIFSGTPVSLKVQELARVISNVEGVQQVLLDSVESDKKNSTLRFAFTIKSDYGTFNYDRTFDNPA